MTEQHNLRIPYSEAQADPELGSWTFWLSVEGRVRHYYAKGPCPACGAEAQGHLTLIGHPIDAQGDRVTSGLTVPATVEVPVRCLCGYAHGEAGAHGCGRFWSIIGDGDPHD